MLKRSDEAAPTSYPRLLASARAFHELVFRTLTSSLLIAILQYGVSRSRSLVLAVLLGFAYSALAIYALCFVRFVLFASFERAGGDHNLRSVLLWIAAGLMTGFVLALPSVFSSVVGLLVKRGPFL